MTTLIDWDEQLSIGIQEIDEQHKVLVDLINELYRAMIEGHAREKNGEILGRLIEYTKTHFVVEESLMRIFGYKDYEGHKARHDDFIARLEDMRREYDSGDTKITLELMEFLKDWLSSHIMRTDTEYAPYFLKLGAKKSWFRKLWS